LSWIKDINGRSPINAYNSRVHFVIITRIEAVDVSGARLSQQIFSDQSYVDPEWKDYGLETQ